MRSWRGLSRDASSILPVEDSDLDRGVLRKDPGTAVDSWEGLRGDLAARLAEKIYQDTKGRDGIDVRGAVRDVIKKVADPSTLTNEVYQKRREGLQQQVMTELKKLYTADMTRMTREIATLRTWSDPSETMLFASHVWERTFKVGMTTEQTFLECNVLAEEMVRAVPSSEDLLLTVGGLEAMGESTDEDRRRVLVERIFWAATWARYAFVRYVTAHTYAAALMCTDVYRTTLEDLTVSFPSFEIVVPDKMLPVSDGLEVVRIHVCMHEKGAWIAGIMKDGIVGFVSRGDTLADALVDEASQEEASVTKVRKLALRLVAGVLLAVQHTKNFNDRMVGGRHAKGQKREGPEHRIVFVGAPIKVDVRSAVSDYLAGRSNKTHGTSCFQILVRGHYKRQVVGVGRSGRKVIWIEPFWRGSEDAPILSRPKSVGGRS